ncbi:LysR substrate-binding domain-containing protein [Pseudonocardia alni]|uniref:LysR substrate-binding domain-containing protein n=1 Tax=Pseudonocardia alni TaxID=33907 RepID=UPI003328654A
MREFLPPLACLQAFEAAARLESFAAAAGELHLAPATISHRIRALETRLGVPLFERMARTVRLTDLGRAYLPSVRDSLDDLSVATVGLFGPARREQLTVRTQVSYATTWLAPHVHEFQDAHPDIDLRIVCAVWSEALKPGEADIDIHQGRGPWAGYGSRLLHEDLAVAVIGPGHLDRYGPVGSVEDLAGRPRVRVLGFDDVWERSLPASAPAPSREITVDTTVAALEMVAVDDACAMIPERFARTAVRSGRVRLAMTQCWPMEQAHYVLSPPGSFRTSPQTRAFLRWLAALELADPPLVGTEQVEK